MLKIGYGCPERICFQVDMEFDTRFEMDWLEDEMNKRIMKEVDNCIFNGLRLQDLTEGYTFAIDDISTGAKALMIVNSVNAIEIWGTIFGDNCLGILLELAETRDITAYFQHIPEFPRNRFKAFSLVLGREYVNYSEFLFECIEQVLAPFTRGECDVNDGNGNNRENTDDFNYID